MSKFFFVALGLFCLDFPHHMAIEIILHFLLSTFIVLIFAFSSLSRKEFILECGLELKIIIFFQMYNTFWQHHSLNTCSLFSHWFEMSV